MTWRCWRWCAGLVAAGGLLATAFHGLGQVDYDTRPTAATPSRPTDLPVHEADLAVQEGRQWAVDHDITRHRDCKAALGPGLRALGCHRQVTARKNIPPLTNGLSEPTTRDCVAAVHAHYVPVLQDMLEQGDDHAVAVWQRKRVAPLVRQCNNIDNGRILRDVHEPLAHLDALLAQVREGRPLTDADLTRLRREHPVVEDFREDPLRTRYLEAAAELFDRLGGREQVFPLALPGSARDAQCTALARQLADLKTAFQRSLSDPAQTDDVALQNRLLSEWTQAQDARLRVGCPAVR